MYLGGGPTIMNVGAQYPYTRPSVHSSEKLDHEGSFPNSTALPTRFVLVGGRGRSRPSLGSSLDGAPPCRVGGPILARKMTQFVPLLIYKVSLHAEGKEGLVCPRGSQFQRSSFPVPMVTAYARIEAPET